MDDEQQVIAEISRGLLGAIAPAELPMFRANSAAFFASPEQALHPVKGKDELLGFGLADAASFVTPVVMQVVTTAVKFVIDELKKSVRTESQSVIAGWVRSLFSQVKAPQSSSSPPASAMLSRDQLALLRKLTVEKALQYVDEAQASRLADELVGRLVTS